MATRMQQRRGTASQWTGANPILNAGELGFESDTNQFKIGDGINHWDDLAYFLDEDGVTSITGSYVETSVLAQNNGVATLDGTGVLTSSQIPDTLAPLESPTFTGTVAGITSTMVGLGNVDNTSDANKPVSTATQTALNLKADLESPTFTGTPTLPTGTVATTQTAGNNSTAIATTAYADAAAAAIVSAAPEALDTLNELAAALGDDSNFATTLSTSIGLKAPLESPTFTGTVSGITSSMVGLGNVDNTSDANKPVSTATQTAIDLKAPLANPTFTGTVSFTGATVSGISSYEAPTLGSTAIASGATVTTISGLTLASPTITGTTKIQQILEKATVSATAANGTVNYDLLTNGAVTYYTSNATGNWTLNVRGDGSTTLDSAMSNDESLTIAFLVTQSTAYYSTTLQIDGNAITPKWQDGEPPAAGNTNSVDIYTYTIIKTGSATFTAFASRTKFA